MFEPSYARAWSGVLLAGLLLASGAAGCTAVLGDEDPPPPQVLMPLDVGNRWTYTVIQAGEATAVETWEVTREVQFGGTVYAQIVKTNARLNNNRVTVDTTYALNRADGLWLDATLERGQITQGTFYKFPVAAGAKFYDPVEQICTATAEGTEVPAGTFGGYLYGRCEDFDAHRVLFTPEVGMIFAGNLDATLAVLGSYELVQE
jgi:hypothetical protein